MNKIIDCTINIGNGAKKRGSKGIRTEKLSEIARDEIEPKIEEIKGTEIVSAMSSKKIGRLRNRCEAFSQKLAKYILKT